MGSSLAETVDTDENGTSQNEKDQIQNISTLRRALPQVTTVLSIVNWND